MTTIKIIKKFRLNYYDTLESFTNCIDKCMEFHKPSISSLSSLSSSLGGGYSKEELIEGLYKFQNLKVIKNLIILSEIIILLINKVFNYLI